MQPEVKKRSTPILSLVKPRAKAGAKAKAKTTAKPKAPKKACAKSAQLQATAKPPAKVSPPKKAERKPKSKIVADKSKVPPKVSSAPVPKRSALKGWRWKVAGLAAIALLAVNWVPLHAGLSMALLDRGLKAWDSTAIESYVDVSGLKSSLSQSERAALATPLDLDRLPEIIGIVPPGDSQVLSALGRKLTIRDDGKPVLTFAVNRPDLGIMIHPEFRLARGALMWQLSGVANLDDIQRSVTEAEDRKLAQANSQTVRELAQLSKGLTYQSAAKGQHKFSDGVLIVTGELPAMKGLDVVNLEGNLQIQGKNTGAVYASTQLNMGSILDRQPKDAFQFEKIWSLDEGRGNDALITAVFDAPEPLDVKVELYRVGFRGGRTIEPFDSYASLMRHKSTNNRKIFSEIAFNNLERVEKAP